MKQTAIFNFSGPMAELEFSPDNSVANLPITAMCIVADKNKAPRGFVPIIKCQDDQSDADLWRDGFFTINRQVRYICVSTEIPESTIRTPVQVVTNLIIVRENDPIPHGYVAIDYTADSREKSLRKKFICIRTEPRDRVVDAIGEVVVLGKTKKVPRNYTSAGEVDSLLICYKVIPIPQTYGIQMSNSATDLPSTTTSSTPNPSKPIGLYPGLSPNSTSQPDLSNTSAFTMRNSGMPRVKAIDGIDFKVNPSFVANSTNSSENLPDLSQLQPKNDYDYSFLTENAVLSA
ncbi:unnamed protein product [Caenorhabditis angaria]|uniref:Multivesicular body subunit 12A n=1 Tax=Caenorhabditis angaria TaxID=860376 RepID=A0A9P1N0X2_9PELO|nr:unnamed protein product [Caenorhabditis angaria]